MGVIVLYLLLVSSAASLLAWALNDMLDYSYYKILSRAVLLFAALGLIPLWRLAGLSAQAIDLAPVRSNQFLQAYGWAVLLIIPPAFFFLVTGFRVLDPRLDFSGFSLWREFLLAVVSGLLVGVFEETLFRGVLFGFLRRLSGFAVSAVIVSILYAMVHFLDVANEQVNDVAWYSGFLFIGEAFSALASPQGYWDAFVALFLLGMLFCWVRERIGLWYCIGLHASWVCSIRMYKVFTVRDIHNPYQVLTSDYDNFVGLLVALWLVFVFVVIYLARQVRARLLELT